MIDIEPRQIDVKVQPCPALGELEVLWRDLEERSEAPFFLSWVWIGSWLEEVQARPSVMMARCAGTIVGLALIGCYASKRYGVTVPTLYLNQSGRRSEDSVFVEFNGFLVDRACAAQVSAACFQAMLEQGDAPPWKEFVLSGVAENVYALALKSGYNIFMRQTRTCPSVELDRVRKDGGDFLSCLSKNTRYQIRRSLRLYQEKGEVHASHASCLEEAQEWLSALEILHQKSWIVKGRSGVFANPFFKEFCNQLLLRGFSDSSVDIVKVSAGAHDFGYLLNFVKGHRVMNYQSGFAYEAHDHYKPGLVAHALAIQEYLDNGKSSYNFLAGDSQYKSSLSNTSEDLYWLAVQKNSIFLRLERGARHMKSFISTWAEGRGA